MSYSPLPNPSSLRPARWLVRHYHDDVTEARSPRQDVVISYWAGLPGALSWALNTASRYEGVLYAQMEEDDVHSVLVRSYRPSSTARREGVAA